jgi:Fatty acid desaturase
MLDLGYWVALPIAVPAAGFLVRLFMIQHDCGHGAFFRERLANDWVGRVIGVFTLTPYDFWRRTHAIHHASSGNLNRRGVGDIDTLTVREYLALSRWGRFRYRVYRHPIIMFGLGPAYLFVLRHRLPIGLMFSGWQAWLSTMATNVAIAAVVATVMSFVGVVPFLLVHLPITCLPHRLACGCSMFSINSRTLSGRKTGYGTCTQQRCTAAHITRYRAFSVGLLPTSECTTYTTFAAASLIIGCPRCCVNIPNLLPPVA